ncbi:hypothetical protein SHKM778_57600 [Streptomyces sp. KM77-8]|uniref:Uncharacterized protein n=1 Tax=Streptomyces haneummycinicus TaxID=3074435 RepID=A0AAT9HPU2_9ACTN
MPPALARAGDAGPDRIERPAPLRRAERVTQCRASKPAGEDTQPGAYGVPSRPPVPPWGYLPGPKLIMREGDGAGVAARSGWRVSAPRPSNKHSRASPRTDTPTRPRLTHHAWALPKPPPDRKPHRRGVPSTEAKPRTATDLMSDTHAHARSWGVQSE